MVTLSLPDDNASFTGPSFLKFLSWQERHFGLLGSLEHLRDGRVAARTRIPLPSILRAVLSLFWLELGSIRALEQRLKANPGLRKFVSVGGWQGTISDDAFADALDLTGIEGLRALLHAQAKRELKRWAAGRYLQSELAQRLRPVGAAGLVSRAVVAIDGHELFSTSERRQCSECCRWKRRAKQAGEWVEFDEYHHKVVVAQWVGVHPAIVLDWEPVKPHQGEYNAAKRLIARLSQVYGKAIGTLLLDGLYNKDEFRGWVSRHGYWSVVRHKDEACQPGASLLLLLNQADPKRQKPDRRYVEPQGRRYALWERFETPGGRRYVEAHRTGPGRHTRGGCVTDLPADRVPAAAVAMLMETRWWIENTGFHELAGQWGWARAFVHTKRPNAVQAIVALALLAYNAFVTYFYRGLGVDPRKPERSCRGLRRDFAETLILWAIPRSHWPRPRPP